MCIEQLDDIMLLSEERISTVEAILGIINGMVGSLVLLLPVYALTAGYVASFISILITGLSCAFSSWIYFQHLGEQPDIGHALMKHLRGSFMAKLLYDCSAWGFLVLTCVQYFQLMVIQWQCVLPSTVWGGWHILSSIANGLLMLGLVLWLKYWQYGATTMVYGIVSIAIYLVYLIWVLASQNIKGNQSQSFQPFSSAAGITSITAAMAQGFMIQIFLVPFLQKLKGKDQDIKNMSRCTNFSYIIGGFVYLFIAEVGAFGISHRTAMWPPGIYGLLAYLPTSWELHLICIVYTLHLYSVFPEFLLISKRIFFEIFERLGLQETSRQSINLQEIIYITAVVIVGVVISIAEVPVQYLMMINGGILGVLIIYLIPSFLHIYCMIYVPSKFRQPFTIATQEYTPHRSSQIEFSAVKQEDRSGGKSSELQDSNQSADTLKIRLISSSEQSRIQFIYVQCTCEHYNRSIIFKSFMVVILSIMMLFGLFVMVEAIRGTFIPPPS